MDEITKAAMLKIIEEKNLKSAQQSGMKREQGKSGNTRKKIKKHKKGGLFDR
ncbi:MAG: hypothetical protein WCR27_06335 [Eubacteriales bacterium]